MEFVGLLNALSSYGPIAVPTAAAIFLAWHLIRRAESNNDDRCAILKEQLVQERADRKEILLENKRLREKIEELLERLYNRTEKR